MIDDNNEELRNRGSGVPKKKKKKVEFSCAIPQSDGPYFRVGNVYPTHRNPFNELKRSEMRRISILLLLPRYGISSQNSYFNSL